MTTRVTKYEVTPVEWTEHDYLTGLASCFTLTVEARGLGKWAVVRSGQCLRHDGRRWAYESMPSSRTERFKRAYRMSEKDALALAEKHVHKMTVYGKTFEELRDEWR
jgi:hypothetical protein